MIASRKSPIMLEHFLMQIVTAKLFKPHDHMNKNLDCVGACKHTARIRENERPEMLACTISHDK